jgi:hypothetical protein
MSFSLVTAINIEDVPLIMRSAARNYYNNAKHDEKVILEHTNLREHHPELWTFAAQILEQSAEMLESQIKECRGRAPVIRVKRAVL